MKVNSTWTTLLLLTLFAAALTGCSDVGKEGSDEGKGGSDIGLSDQPSLDLTGDLQGDSEIQVADAPVDAPAQEMAFQQFQLPGDPCVPPTSPLVINEIMVDPNAVSDLYGEWVEIYNPHSASVNIGGFKLQDNSGSHTLPSVNIPSGGYFVICRNADSNLNGGVTCNHQWSGGIALANTGDVVRLLQADNSVIDEVSWTTTAPVGKSFALKNPHLNNSDTSNGNWAESSSAYGAGDKGTPGAKNSDVFTVVDDPECADGNICTNDICDLGVCKNPWKQGCCLTNADCNDNNICTSDLCLTETNTCTYSPIANCCTTDADCADDNPCNMDVCLNNECRHTAYNVIPGCCWAPPGTQDPQAFADAQCDDKVNCTEDKCDLTTNTCYVAGTIPGCCNGGADCDDGNICTVDYCLNSTCSYVTKPGCCTDNSQCADTDPCTNDICLLNLCRNFPIVGDGTDGACCYEDKHCPVDPNVTNACYDKKCVNKQCVSVTKSPCMVSIPYQEGFDSATTLKSIGWGVVDYGTPAKNNWVFTPHCSGQGQSVKFTWSPTTPNVKTVLTSPIIDTSKAILDCGYFDNQQCKVTIQFDHSYKHYGGTVKLSVVGTTNGDFLNGTELWSVTPTADLPFDIKSIVLPVSLTGSPTLQIGFMVETDSTFNLDSWTIDRFKIKASLKPEIIGGISDIVIGVNESLKKTYKAVDPDHFTSPYTQTPLFSFFGCPYDPIPFATIDPTTFVDVQGNFYKHITYNPNGNENLVGEYKAGLLIKEGGGGDSVRLESLHTFTITVLLNSGYLVWSPKGSDLTTAVELKNALIENGRKAQILENLNAYNDLSVLDGIFVVLGVYGSNHVMTAAEANRLKEFLDSGGKLYLEGGDFWFADPKTALHPYFNIEATSDGSIKLDGPVNGYNFLYGYNYDYSQSLTLNNFIDRIKNKVGTDSRIIQRNMGTKQFGTVVANQGAGYRTIGASTLFAGYIPQESGMTKKDLMAKYIYFLENGWPPCSNDNQCDDLDVCTADTCNAPVCSNDPITDCIPCSDDSVCPITKACNLTLGYCVPIPGNMFTSTDVPKSFGSNPALIYSTKEISTNGKITDLYLKVQIDHNYRGDVELKLAHAGKEVILKSNDPFDSGDNIYATYDIVPSVDPMTTFDNSSLQGLWTLTVQDKDPLLNNGVLKDWRIFAVYEQQSCMTPADCDDGNFCTDEDCVNNTCVWTEHNCDDSNPATIDSCDLATGQCKHETISHCPSCDCLYHYNCGYDDVCLEEVSQVVCNPSNPQNCKCYPIEGTPYYITSGLPVAIPDNNNSGVTVTRTITTGESTGVVRDLNVKFYTAHPSIGDLRAILCKEAVCVTMHNKSGGTADGFYKVFDYDDVDGPGSILDFKGLKVAGTWSFKVVDNVAGDTGDFKDGTLYIKETQCLKNSDCDDGNICTTDLCTVVGDVGTCSNLELPCAPNPHPCKYNQCNPTTGACEEYNKANGSACDDNLYCTVDDSCNNSVCSGIPRDCSGLNDQCLNGVCSEENMMCVYEPKQDGTTCEDGDICTGGDQCIGGVCQTGNTPVCTCVNDLDCIDDGNKCNGTQWFCNAEKKCQLLDTPVQCPDPPDQCKKYQCNPLTGQCVLYNHLNGYPCNDGLFCTIADTCQAGVCVGGGERDCSIETDQCNIGTCNEDTDLCVKSPVADGTICEKDGLGCTIDTCTTGACLYSGQNVDCSSVNDDCNSGICSNIGWGSYQCVKEPFPDGTPVPSGCQNEMPDDPCTANVCYSGICTHPKLQHCTGPCEGTHAHNAGDNICGLDDACINGLLGEPTGHCEPACIGATCEAVESGVLDADIRETLPCVQSTLSLVSAYQFVENAYAKLNLEHSYIGDLVISLIDPSGYEHTIWKNLGGANVDFYNTFDRSYPNTSLPMCRFGGDTPSGNWTLKVCDIGPDNGGILRSWKLYMKGTNVDPNAGQKCENAITIDTSPGTRTIVGDTTCAQNNQSGSCGGTDGLDRVYKLNITVPTRVTISVPQSTQDRVIYIKEESGGTCAADSIYCKDDFPAGDAPEVIDVQKYPGTYYFTVDTAGNAYDYGPFSFDITFFVLLDDGQACTEDIQCKSTHCQNGYCCQSGDCCPGNEWIWTYPNNDPTWLAENNPDWLSAQMVCPAIYKQDPVCVTEAPPPGCKKEPGGAITDCGAATCQGYRLDKQCSNYMCTSTRIDDDTKCDGTVESDLCGYYVSVYCSADLNQFDPPCPTYCQQDSDCDPNAHCDPPNATDPDPAQPPYVMTCQADLPNGSASNEDSDCISGHSKNGYCCDDPDGPGPIEPDCCPGVNMWSDPYSGNDPDWVLADTICPASYKEAPQCDQVATCQGHRVDKTCVNYTCGSSIVQDDSACDPSDGISNNCGLFIPVYCTGEIFQTSDQASRCLVCCLGNGAKEGETCSGLENDNLCDDIAHCDPDPLNPGISICQADAPDGYACDEGSDCANVQQHCRNGYCCSSNNPLADCCSRDPITMNDPYPPSCPSSYQYPSVCDDQVHCQGHRGDKACDSNYVCYLNEPVPDDSGCEGLLYLNGCGYWLDDYCTDAQDQNPQCPTTCLDAFGVENDLKCDLNGHCDPDTTPGGDPNNSICVADVPQDGECDEESDCFTHFNHYCQIGFCCPIGDCCKGCRVTSWAPNFSQGGPASNPPTGPVYQWSHTVNYWQWTTGQPSPIGRSDGGGSGTEVDAADWGFLTNAAVRKF